MNKDVLSQSSLMARLTLSAIERMRKDPYCWKEPTVHKALLISGLSVLMAANKLLKEDLET